MSHEMPQKAGRWFYLISAWRQVYRTIYCLFTSCYLSSCPSFFSLLKYKAHKHDNRKTVSSRNAYLERQDTQLSRVQRSIRVTIEGAALFFVARGEKTRTGHALHSGDTSEVWKQMFSCTSCTDVSTHVWQGRSAPDQPPHQAVSHRGRRSTGWKLERIGVKKLAANLSDPTL